MKKILVLLAFVSFGTFANASNLAVKKTARIVIPLKTMSSSQSLKSGITEFKVTLTEKCGVAQWMYSYTCGGVFHAACCYNSQADALSAGNAAMACDPTC